MKPTEENLLSDYLNAVDSLTVNIEYLSQKLVERIKQETRDNEYIIKGKLQERDDQIQKLMKKQEHFERMIQSLIDSDVLSPS